MKPFLEAVAEAYIDNDADRLIDCCFVFPNKRSATFFTDYLASASRRKGVRMVHPATTTIVDFVEDFSEGDQAERMEMIFILYDVYREVVRKHHGATEAMSIDFNRFVHWADVLLNDFDDVDNSLAEPAELFRNVSGLKEISANYLTPDQVEVIRHFWSDDKVPQEVQEFWTHIAHPASEGGSKATTGFLRLWQVMGEIYDDFHSRLRSLNLHTSGMAYRDVARFFKEAEPCQLPFRRYVFVGFNNLSAAEKSIFSRLLSMRDTGWGTPLGDFYWDVASPAFNDANQSGGRQVKKYSEDFPSLYSCPEPIRSFPHIEVTGVPSRVGQGKVIGGILSKLFPSGSDTDMDELRRTAIVMPEENMLIPLLNSLPPHISPLNITMGYKLRNTSVAGLMRDIVSMQMRAYSSPMANTFYYEDVVNVLSHPLVRTFKPLLCTSILLEMQQKRLFNVPETMFSEPRFSGMEAVFTLIADHTASGYVFEYIARLLEWLGNAVSEAGCTDDQDEEHNLVQTEGMTHSEVLQHAFLRRYADAVRRLRELCAVYLDKEGVHLENATVFGLVERMVQGEMLNFEGVPLKGLQIMGVLEARALDFETLIIPSMNERVFPRARFTGSFIPVVLRKAYKLPTPDDQENVYSYFFYRMISRAKRVFLLYDARSTGLKSRQMSRYIHQLVHIVKPAGMIKTVLPYRLCSPAATDIGVAKTPEMMEVINRFRSKDNALYLSASSIKQYVGCPMSFYFERVARYRREDEMNDWMGESVLGTIVHDVFEHLFGQQLEKSPDGVVITAAMLEEMRSDTLGIDKLICRAVNEYYRKLGKECYEPLKGDSRLIGFLVKENVREVLRKEKALAPFTYLHGEWKGEGPLSLTGSDGRSLTFNFKCFIDRVDRYDGDTLFPRLRVIDYKTGSDQTEISSMAQMFHDYQRKAFLQVMLYAMAYSEFNRCDEPIQPMIYAMRSLMIKPVLPLGVPQPSGPVEHEELKRPSNPRGKWKMLDYRDYMKEFNDMLIPYLEELFDPDVPFRCADNDDACKYCAFKAICRKENK